ncbi:MAG: hypothetical protein K6B12_04205, partial [Clostridiales bacterium]|nr:hypothetical protein [Clostridiales bacterium]
MTETLPQGIFGKKDRYYYFVKKESRRLSCVRQQPVFLLFQADRGRIGMTAQAFAFCEPFNDRRKLL